MRVLRQAVTAIYLILFLSASTIFAATQAKQAKVAVQPPVKVAEVEGFTEYRLHNGLRVLLFPDQSKPTIAVNVTYLVGSRHEGYGETGMAHLLEHLLFKGTKNIPDIAKEFNGRGMRFNGSTTSDRTNYFELFQANDENLEWALMMEAERMVSANVSKTDLDTEMTVVRNEFEIGENNPIAVLVKRLQSVAYDWHNYGNSTIGNRSDIENVEIENLQAFYRKYYQPDNAMLVVAGKFDTAKTLQLIGKYFGAIPKPTRQLPKLWTVEPTQDGERSFVVRRNDEIQILFIAYKCPSFLHPDSDALNYAGSILADAPSGRLHKALVETGKAVQVLSVPLGGADGSLYIFGAFVKHGDPIEPVRDEMIRLLEEFADNPPTDEEMERVRRNLANFAERIVNDHENIGIALSEYIALGDWRAFFLLRDRRQGITADQVKEISAKYYLRDNRTVGTFMQETGTPRRAEVPRAESAENLLKSYQPKQAMVEVEEFNPTPENIEQRIKRHEKNGIKIALMPKKTRGEMVHFAIRLDYGDSKSRFGQSYIELLVNSMRMRGTSRYTREQLNDEFSRLKITQSQSGFQTTRPNIGEAIRLYGHILQEMSFPESELEQIRGNFTAAMEMALTDPSAKARDAMAEHFNIYPKGDPRYANKTQDILDGIRTVTIEDLKQFHKKFYAANNAKISVLGDFDESEVLQAIAESLGNWRNDTPWELVVGDYRDIVAKNITVETPDKENAILMARINLDINLDDPDYAALMLANYMLGSGAGFDSRLVGRIRVKEGLSYAVNSQLAVPVFGRLGSWNMMAMAAPQNIARAEAALIEELDKALKDGFTKEEVAKAKSGWQQGEAQALAQDAALANRLLQYLGEDRTLLTWDKALEERVLALTPEQVLAALRKHITPSKLTIVKAGDFQKVAQ